MGHKMDFVNFAIIGALSILAGILIGWNRRCKGAGVRDFSLIIMGISLLTFTLEEVVEPSGVYEGLSNLVIAMGFLAAGIMYNQQNKVIGITTGLAIFTSSIIGILFGLQQYIYGITLAILSTIILMLNKAHKTCE